MTVPATTPLKFLDKALGVLRNLGLIKSEPEPAPIVALIDRIAHLEPDKAAAIARTLSQASLFNEVVREQIEAMQISERYSKITKAFDSIRDDAKNMVEQMKDNRIDTFERLGNIWMKITRGDIPSRFEKIKDTYLEVTKDTRDQIQREQTILEAYADFRTALKESQVLGFKLLERAEEELARKKQRDGNGKGKEMRKGNNRQGEEPILIIPFGLICIPFLCWVIVRVMILLGIG